MGPGWVGDYAPAPLTQRQPGGPKRGPPRPIAKRHTLADGAGGAIDLFQFYMTQFEKDGLSAYNIMESSRSTTG